MLRGLGGGHVRRQRVADGWCGLASQPEAVPNDIVVANLPHPLIWRSFSDLNLLIRLVTALQYDAALLGPPSDPHHPWLLGAQFPLPGHVVA